MQFRELIMRLSYENMNEFLKLCKVKSKCSYTLGLRAADWPTVAKITLFQNFTAINVQKFPS